MTTAATARTLTRSAACREFGISQTALSRLIAAGTVRAVEVPGYRYPRVVRAGLEAWLEGGAPMPERPPAPVFLPRVI